MLGLYFTYLEENQFICRITTKRLFSYGRVAHFIMDRDFNVCITSYDRLRDYLRYFFIYGCYSREDFDDIRGLNSRTYDDELRRIRTILRDEYLKELTRGRKKYVRLDFSYYTFTENYLVETYLIRNYTNLNLSIFFNVYNFLWQNQELSLDQVNEMIENRISIENDFSSTTRRILEDMSAKGVIDKYKEHKRVVYKRRMDIFEDITDSELVRLYTGISYFSQVKYPLSVAKYVKDSLYSYARYVRNLNVDGLEDLFLFRFADFQKIIDEEIVWKLENIIENRSKIKLGYYTCEDTEKVVTAFPFKIVWDNNYGKWYLEIITEGNELITIAVQDIVEIEELNSQILDDDLEHILDRCRSNRDKHRKGIDVLFKVEKFNKRNFLLDKVNRGNWGGNLKLIDRYTFIYTIYTDDWKSLKPWIMSFGYRAKVIKSDQNERYEDIKREWIEMGEMYGIVCGTEE